MVVEVRTVIEHVHRHPQLAGRGTSLIPLRPGLHAREWIRTHVAAWLRVPHLTELALAALTMGLVGFLFLAVRHGVQLAPIRFLP
jgi:hypothetical protein